MQIRLIRWAETVRVLPFDQPRVTIGQASTCDLAIPSSNFSKLHTILYRFEDVVLVADAYSTSGTYVDGRKTRRAIIGPTARIGLREHQLAVDGCRVPTAAEVAALCAREELPIALLLQLALLAPEAPEPATSIAARVAAMAPGTADLLPVDLAALKLSSFGGLPPIAIEVAARSVDASVRLAAEQALTRGQQP